MNDESVDLTLTDIPYGEVNRDSNGLRELDKGKADIVDFDLEEMINEIIRVTKGSIYIWCGYEQVSFIRKKLKENGLSTRIMVWTKTNPSPMNGQHIWLSGVELCVYAKKSGATFNDNCRNTNLNYSSGSSKIHETQKSVDMFRDLIRVSSNKNDIVFDPFIGSGTTAIASYKEDRNYIGVEKDKENYHNCIDRVNKETAQMKLFG